MLPHGAYRESSFLRNKRLPPAVNESRVHIAICMPGEVKEDNICAGAPFPARSLSCVIRFDCSASQQMDLVT